MHALFAVIAPLILAAEPIDAKLAQVAPVFHEAAPWRRSAGQERAVVLLHGLRIHPFSSSKVTKAEWHSWQKSDSTLVQALARNADVYAFAYSQNVPVDDIAGARGLPEGIARLKELGYAEIVLVGHSAGGLIARQFVEDQPKAGVTKVIQVCTPNGGSSWGKAVLGVRQNQEAFLTSLTKQCRADVCAKRKDKKIPEHVEFVCVMGHLQVELQGEVGNEDIIVAANVSLRGDGVVSSVRQWTPDLQEQGIPVVPIEAAHFSVMRGKSSAERIARLVRERHPRWRPAEVAAARKRLLGYKDRP